MRYTNRHFTYLLTYLRSLVEFESEGFRRLFPWNLTNSQKVKLAFALWVGVNWSVVQWQMQWVLLSLVSSLVLTTSRPVADTSPNSSSWTRNHHCTICCPTSVTSILWTDFLAQKHLNYHKPELKDSKNHSSHTVLHISNSIYGRYTLFNWLLVLAWTLYF